MNIDSKIKELFTLLKKRPSMLIMGDINSLISYIVFFEGFFLSLKLFKNIDVEREISSWYQNKVKTKASNMYFFSQFELENKNLNEKEKIDLLLRLISDFFSENPAPAPQSVPT
jgi:hypothetical protein